MFKLFAGVFVIVLVPYFVHSAKPDVKDDVPVINEDLPFILIKTDLGDLVTPRDVELKKKWLRKAKIKFSCSLFDKQIFYCPAETDKQMKKITKANQVHNRIPNRLGDEITKNCLFRKKKTKKSTRFPKCENPLEPQTMVALREKQTAAINGNEDGDVDVELDTCGPFNAGQSLIFGYQICDEYDGLEKFLYPLYSNKEDVYPFRVKGIEILEICYNAEKIEILYISHGITAPALLTNKLLEKEVMKKPSEEIRTNELNHIKTDFERIKINFEKIDMSETVPFKIQLLAPLDDFPFLSWKKPAYHYVNASLMHANLHSYWDRINNIIRQNSKQTKRYFTVHTRVFKIPDKPSPAAVKEIEDAYKVEIPSIWVKIVHYRKIRAEKKALAIFANNYRNETVNDYITTQYGCARNLCWHTLRHTFKNVDTSDFRCCQVTPEIQALFELDLNSYDVLDIYSLVGESAVNGKPLPRAVTSPTTHHQSSQVF